MALNIKLLTEQLEISDQQLSDRKMLIVQSLDNEIKMRDLLRLQLLDRRETHCFSCDNQGDCFILNGIIYLRLKEGEKAIKEFESANWHLRSKNETWNSITGLVLLGIALEECGKNHLALSEYKKAYQTLTNHFLRIHVYDPVEKASQLKNELQDKIKELSALNPLDTSDSQENSRNINPNTSSINDKDYLTIFSIPIYGTVEAGLDGALQVDHFNIFTFVNQVELKKQLYDVYNVHGTAEADRQITVTTKREHGWLRVHGLSMNGWDLPINENDYVLFYKSQTAEHLDFVIASNSDPSGEISLIVKRFDKDKNRLLSNSKDTSKEYEPIPVDEEHQIMGIVIAVAKPVK